MEDRELVVRRAHGDEIEEAIPIEVGADDRGGPSGGGEVERPPEERARPGEEEGDRGAAAVGRGKVGPAVAVEVSGRQRGRPFSEREAPLSLEGAVAKPAEKGEVVRAGVRAG